MLAWSDPKGSTKGSKGIFRRWNGRLPDLANVANKHNTEAWHRNI